MEEFKPKVFISYTWTNNEYINKVADFAKRLIQDGIDVLFDQFEMKPGKSLNNYMEKCVNDPTVTNVLLLLSPDYKEKADSRTGGTGIETQIISTEVYNNLDNEKFIPILFETRGKNPGDCVPTYLKDRYRLDLSNPNTYEDMYMAVVRTIYRQETFIKPQLGIKPEWVSVPNTVSNQLKLSDISNLNNFKNVSALEAKNYAIKSLNNILNNVLSLKFESINVSSFETEYQKFDQLKYNYLAFLNELIFDEKIEDLIFDFYKNITSHIGYDTQEEISKNILLRVFKHETIIETIAILFKNKKYRTIYEIINSSYIENKKYEITDFKYYFYSLADSQIYNLDEGLGYKYKENNETRKYTGIGHYWMKHIPEPYITRNEFSFADVLITNIVAGLDNDKFGWFALTYVYSYDDNDWLKIIATSFKSKKLGKEFMPLFGINDIEGIKSILVNISEMDKDRSYRFGYSGAFYTIPFISKFIKIEDVGTYN